MRNIFFTSLIVLLCSNGFVYSQGLPENITITSRTVVKDTLGNVIKLADYAEQLNSGDWILHRENNEGGKLLYILLMKATKAEKELLSEKRVATIQDEDIKAVRKGKFTVRTEEFNSLSIKRRRNTQIEFGINSERISKSKHKIVWLDDASYVLMRDRRDEITPETLRYKLVEVQDDYYIARVVGKNFLGETFKVNFKIEPDF